MENTLISPKISWPYDKDFFFGGGGGGGGNKIYRFHFEIQLTKIFFCDSSSLHLSGWVTLWFIPAASKSVFFILFYYKALYSCFML